MVDRGIRDESIIAAMAGRSLLCLLLIACDTGFIGQSGPGRKPASTFLQKLRTFHTREEFDRSARQRVTLLNQARCKRSDGDLLIGSTQGIVLQKSGGALHPFPPDRMLPHTDVTVIGEESPGRIWVGTRRGAVRLETSSGRTHAQYFAGRRWLPDDRVSAIGFERLESGRSGNAVWVETAGGFSRIEYKPMTLAEKARFFEERVRSRHVRHGFTAGSRQRTPGDLESNQPVSSDNDGLWTAMYLAAECFRYGVTKDVKAREYAREGLKALMRLESITGIPGFPARSFIRKGAEEQPKDGEWHETPDGQWLWKGDTSSDEIVGHYFAYSVYYDLLADESEKEQIRAVVDRITAHILDKGYHLIDLDGKPTRWGWWAPEEIWMDADETGLRALHLLSHLRVAQHISRNPRYQAAYQELIGRHRYAQLMRNQKINVPGRVNHSDDELAFLSFYPLLLYEQDPELKKVYIESLERSWQIERPERNPLWNYIYAAGAGSASFDRAESLRTLEEIPMDLVSWTVTNSTRLDIVLDPAGDRFGRRQSLIVLPVDERPVMKWNGNPYIVDGGDDGRSEDDGAFFLLPYWLGRYHRLID